MNFINYTTVENINRKCQVLNIKENLTFSVLEQNLKTELIHINNLQILNFVLNIKKIKPQLCLFFKNNKVIKIIEIPKSLVYYDAISIEIKKFEFDFVQIGFVEKYLLNNYTEIFNNGVNYTIENPLKKILKNRPLNSKIYDFYSPQILISFKSKPQDGSVLNFKFFDFYLSLYPNSRYDISEFDENQFSTSGTLTQTIENIKNCIFKNLIDNGIAINVETKIYDKKPSIYIKSNYVHPFSNLDFNFQNVEGALDFCYFKIEKLGYNNKVVELNIDNGPVEFLSLLNNSTGYYKLFNDETFFIDSNTFSFIPIIENFKDIESISFGIDSLYNLKTPLIRNTDFINIATYNNQVQKINEQLNYSNKVSYFENFKVYGKNINFLNIVAINKLDINSIYHKIDNSTLNIIFTFPFIKSIFNENNYPNNNKLFDIKINVKNWINKKLEFVDSIWWLNYIQKFNLILDYTNNGITYQLKIIGINFIHNNFEYDCIEFKINNNVIKLTKQLKISKITYPILSKILKFSNYKLETEYDNLLNKIFIDNRIIKIKDELFIEILKSKSNYYKDFHKLNNF